MRIDTRVVTYPNSNTTRVVFGNQPELVLNETVVGNTYHLALTESEVCLGTLTVEEWEAPTLYSSALSTEQIQVALVAYGLKGLIKLPL
jgi:hypothetical protein